MLMQLLSTLGMQEVSVQQGSLVKTKVCYLPALMQQHVKRQLQTNLVTVWNQQRDGTDVSSKFKTLQDALSKQMVWLLRSRMWWLLG